MQILRINRYKFHTHTACRPTIQEIQYFSILILNSIERPGSRLCMQHLPGYVQLYSVTLQEHSTAQYLALVTPPLSIFDIHPPPYILLSMIKR